MRGLAAVLVTFVLSVVANCNTNTCEDDCIKAKEKCGDTQPNFHEECETRCFGDSECTLCWECQAGKACDECREICAGPHDVNSPEGQMRCQ